MSRHKGERELRVADKVNLGNLEECVVVAADEFGVLDGLSADLMDVLGSHAATSFSVRQFGWTRRLGQTKLL